MAHLIENTGTELLTADMAYCAKFGTPWWGGGAQIDDLFSTNFIRNNLPAIAAPVIKVPTYCKLEVEGQVRWMDSKHFALVNERPNGGRRIVGNCTSTYGLNHHLDDVDIVGQALGFGPDDNWLDTIGLLLGGERAFAGIYLGDQFQVKGEDRIDLRLTFSTGYNGQARKLYITAVRPVCANTVRLGEINAESMVTARHTSRGNDVLKRGAEKMGIVQKQAAEFAEFCKQMARTDLNTAQVTEFFNEIFPARRSMMAEPVEPELTGNAIEDTRRRLTYQQAKEQYNEQLNRKPMSRSGNSLKLDDILQTQPGADGSASLWQAFNAVTYFVDHQREGRGTKGDDAQTKLDKRIVSNLLDGTGNDIKDKAVALARKILV